jgi:two-component system, OmpR family, sensor kinase
LRSLFRHWPVRWRITGISAGLTLLILLCFALIVGRLATDRLKDNFEQDLLGVASQIRANIQLDRNPGEGISEPDLSAMAMAGDAAIRIVDESGRVVEGEQTPGAPELGRPIGGITGSGRFDVVSLPVATNSITGAQLYLQYARSRDSLESTVDRLWLLLAGGVLGGAFLAALAGFAIAGRAMRPISSLTAAAREIAATRDPSLRLPETETDDEVAELARTLDEMLRELDAARSETEQMIQAQRDFVADASHELRTPLTSILANLELLEASLAARGADPEDEEIVAGALGSSRRMRRLVSDLLLLAHADAGRAGPRRECDLVEIATTAVAEVRPVAPDHRLQVESDGPVPVDGNPDDLHRLAVNLVENGVRHTPPGSAVAVAVVRRDDEALLEVTDDGPGIPEEVGDQLFARFVRGDGPADLSVETGTGLGLAIVKAVAIAHGGSVEAGRSPAGGARFSVRLPLGGVLGEQALTDAPTRAAKL